MSSSPEGRIPGGPLIAELTAPLEGASTSTNQEDEELLFRQFKAEREEQQRREEQRQAAELAEEQAAERARLDAELKHEANIKRQAALEQAGLRAYIGDARAIVITADNCGLHEMSIVGLLSVAAALGFNTLQHSMTSHHGQDYNSRSQSQYKQMWTLLRTILGPDLTVEQQRTLKRCLEAACIQGSCWAVCR